jgi:glucose/arabinose dehydrogenase
MGGAGGGSGGGGGMPMVCQPGTTGALPALKLTEVANGLARPTYVTGAPEDTTRLYVIEKPGRIRIIKDGALLPEPFLDATGPVNSGANERGLLGLAFHPQYVTNGRFYIYYTRDGDGAIEIAEYTRGMGTPDVADPASAKVLLTVPHPGHDNHNGGMLAFGADGKLYIGTGDGGGGGDPDDNGENKNSQLGKILRIDVDTHPQPPPGNIPDGDQYVWDWGLRNPWRFSFDRCTQDLYIADVGQNEWEEVNVELPGDGQKNYGWDVMEGKHCFEPAQNCDMSGKTLPVTEYNHNNGAPMDDCSVTGGYVYRGTKIPGLVGTYLYGDYCTKRVYTLAWEKGAILKEGEVTAELDSVSLSGGITSFGEDTAGELYIIADGNPGRIFRIDPE